MQAIDKHRSLSSSTSGEDVPSVGILASVVDDDVTLKEQHISLTPVWYGNCHSYKSLEVVLSDIECNSLLSCIISENKILLLLMII